MKMNWLLITVLVILVFFLIRGYTRGFVKIVMSLISIVLVMTFVTWATPYISGFLEKNTTLYTSIETRCEKSITDKLNEKISGEIEEKQEEAAADSILSGLPIAIQKWMTETTTDATKKVVEEGGIAESIASQLAHFIVNGVSFLIALVLAGILMHFITGVFELAAKMPLLNSVNKILGLLAGGCQGLLVVWIAFYIIALCYQSTYGSMLQELIYESKALTYLYNNNLLVTLSILFL